MVSFSCESCNETMAKKKVQMHINRCRAPVTCIDCSTVFPGQSFKAHNSCITEAEKYQGNLYKPKPQKQTPQGSKPEEKKEDKEEEKKKEEKKEEEKKVEKKVGKAHKKERKDKKQKEDKSKPSNVPIRIEKPMTLKRLIRTIRKSNNLSKDEVLEKVTISANGEVLLN